MSDKTNHEIIVLELELDYQSRAARPHHTVVAHLTGLLTATKLKQSKTKNPAKVSITCSHLMNKVLSLEPSSVEIHYKNIFHSN